ncbi:hypothetical protein BTVI_06649 [Pitangus sulphuratus]|nr:hypothetical protein BTVI_06649 [Pitangus sulphuratus]
MKMADAKQKRNEQLKRWIGSETDLEPPVVKRKKTKVKFDDGAVFLAACSSGDTEEVLRLLERGADINYANVDGLTALHQDRIWRCAVEPLVSLDRSCVVLVPEKCDMEAEKLVERNGSSIPTRKDTAGIPDETVASLVLGSVQTSGDIASALQCNIVEDVYEVWGGKTQPKI